MYQLSHQWIFRGFSYSTSTLYKKIKLFYKLFFKSFFSQETISQDDNLRLNLVENNKKVNSTKEIFFFFFFFLSTLSAWAVDYSDCISTEG